MRTIIAVAGPQRAPPEVIQLAEALGKRLVDEGFRIACGGLGGVMEAVARGAHRSPHWDASAVIGLLPGWSVGEQPNPWVDIPLRTHLGTMRNNLLVRVADALIALHGRAGTLSEISLAWQEGIPVAAFEGHGGFADDFAGFALDDRRNDQIAPLKDVDSAIHWLDEFFPKGAFHQRDCQQWWHGEIPCLHRIHDGVPKGAQSIQASLEMSLSSKVVRRRLEGLADEVKRWNNLHGQKRRALVTFDDGYKDILQLMEVFAIRQELQPVLFIPNSILEGDHHALPLDCFYHWCVEQGIDPEAGSAEQGVSRSSLKQVPQEEQYEILVRAGISIDLGIENYLSLDDLHELVEKDWIVGSHAHEHCILTQMENQKLYIGLEQCLDNLLEHGFTPWLAWPEGEYNEQAAKTARRAGFTLQFDVGGRSDGGASKEFASRTIWR